MMKLNVANIGLIDYQKALHMQQCLQRLRRDHRIADTLIWLEHYPVITLGRRGNYDNLLISQEQLKKDKVDMYEVNRGGDITFHGPGQLVGYCIFDLKNHGRDIRKFIWKIQEVFIRLLAEAYGIKSHREDGVLAGVWIGNDKITAIGIAVARWITMHGFAFNINTNLERFKWINPCGMTDKGVTSLEKLTGKKQDIANVMEKLTGIFCEVFNMAPVGWGKETLLEITGGCTNARSQA